MAARRPFWKWHRWKSIGFCLWPPSTCIWNLKLKFQSKLELCSGNHVFYRQTDGRTDRRTDGRTDRRTRWIHYTPPPTSLGGGIITDIHTHKHIYQWNNTKMAKNETFHIHVKSEPGYSPKYPKHVFSVIGLSLCRHGHDHNNATNHKMRR